jgi:hypothetical protein
MMLYFSIGLMDMLSILYRSCGGEEPNRTGQRENIPPYACTLICILLTAAAIPLADGRVFARTTADTPTATKSAWFTSVFQEA